MFALGCLSLAPSWGWSAIDCRQSPPSRASSEYWDYLEICGCTNVEPLSRASIDYEKWSSVCAASLRQAEEARTAAEALRDAEAHHCDDPHETKPAVADREVDPAAEAPSAPPAQATEPPPPEAKPVAARVISNQHR